MNDIWLNDNKKKPSLDSLRSAVAVYTQVSITEQVNAIHFKLKL